MKKINEQTGCWKPSTGSMYPLLDNLLEKKLVKVKKEGRRRVYSLTEEGKEFLKTLAQKKEQHLTKVIEDCKIMRCLIDKKNIREILDDTVKKLDKLK